MYIGVKSALKKRGHGNESVLKHCAWPGCVCDLSSMGMSIFEHQNELAVAIEHC